VYDVAYPFVEGGGQRRLWEVGTRLADEGHTVDWVSFQSWEGAACKGNINGINYIGLPGYHGLYQKDGSRRRIEPLEFLFALWTSKIRFSDYDCIWSGQWPMAHFVWWLLWPRSIGTTRLVVDWWEIWGATWFRYSRLVGWLGYALERTLVKLLASRGTLVLVAPSALRKARLMSPDGNMELIHNGIDLDFFLRQEQIARTWDVVSLGRLKNHKRIDLLLYALDYLNRCHGLRLTTVIVGDGPEKDALMHLAEKLNLTKQVYFAGAVASNEDAYGFLRSSKVFVNPSTKEGGGSITVLEAFASGLPVLAFDCPDGIDPELVQDGFAGKLVRTVSSEALGDALREIFCDERQMRHLQAGALECSLDFDWAKISRSYYELFFCETKPSLNTLDK